MSNKCNGCKFFQRYRGQKFGSCNNDMLFQYAEDKSDLENFDSDSLILMGDDITPVVGENYSCFLFEPKQKSYEGMPNPTKDFKGHHTQGYHPPAQQKRMNND